MNECVILQQNIKLNDTAADWIAAVRQSGKLLVDSEFVTNEYIEANINSIKELGPYVVLAPGLALAHSRPSESVLKTGVSLLTLKEAVNFNCDFDPVNIVLTLAAKNNDEHHHMLEVLSFYLIEEGKLDFIRNCNDASELAKDINEFKVDSE